MNKKIRYIFIAVIFAFILVLAIPATSWSKSNATALQKRYESPLSPIIMIPGSSATVNRFDTLIQRINQIDHKNHSLLKVKVFNDGHITYAGSIRERDTQPFIVVGFENNHDGYSNIKKQARMFNQAFNQLTRRYNFNHFNGIGHSNGGLIYTAFLENYYRGQNVRINKLMTIGTPYNFAETRSRQTEMLHDFIKNRNRIPDNLIMYSVAGTQNYVADGLVPVSSVEAGKYIYQGTAKSYTQITVTGRLAQHSALPQNNEVIELIQRYILNQRPRQRNNLANR
ncbi:alpha/beta hydrolase [Lactobacillus johnsonii]|uniref:alpha/beta hydrolase n=1 Tax=Lactobacillus johnsonii TaxID=33959 RepID=UPI0028E4A42B|nr:alpha/beta hydrolase [Lactobacillus johnsonii]MDT9605513.1 alpha/beta hydrolase [Lactobacillus johnsonii]